MYRFYQPDIKKGAYHLPDDEAHHALRVMRMQEGDFLEVVDGKGNLARARLKVLSRNNCGFVVEEWVEEKSGPASLHVAIAPPKNIDRFAFFLEKSTEAGIAQITPLLCQRSERKNINPERLRKIMVSAMKQSLRLHLPQLNPMISFKDFIKQVEKPAFMAHLSEKTGVPPSFRKAYAAGQPAMVMIGPEGDFTPEEVKLALSHDVQLVSLGKKRLRTETAGLVVATAFFIMNEM